jgi:hypothetical protein
MQGPWNDCSHWHELQRIQPELAVADPLVDHPLFGSQFDGLRPILHLPLPPAADPQLVPTGRELTFAGKYMWEY